MSGERDIFRLPSAQYIQDDNPQLLEVYTRADALHTLLFPEGQDQSERMKMLNAMLLALGRVAAMVETEGGEQEFGSCIEHHKEMFLERYKEKQAAKDKAEGRRVKHDA